MPILLLTVKKPFQSSLLATAVSDICLDQAERAALACDEAGGPGGLEVVAPSDAVQVQHLARQEESGAHAALHAAEGHLAKLHAPASDELVPVQPAPCNNTSTTTSCN